MVSKKKLLFVYTIERRNRISMMQKREKCTEMTVQWIACWVWFLHFWEGPDVNALLVELSYSPLPPSLQCC